MRDDPDTWVASVQAGGGVGGSFLASGSHIRHPIYSGIMLALAGLALLRPTPTVILAAAVAAGALLVQARLEEVDLLQRLPSYREYTEEVPQFIPRVGRTTRMVRRDDSSYGPDAGR